MIKIMKLVTGFTATRRPAGHFALKENFIMNSLKDVLSHLTFHKACKLLGPEGRTLIRAGGGYDIDIYTQASLRKDEFRFQIGGARVTITLDGTERQTLHIHCAKCAEPCIHQGAALSVILKTKWHWGWPPFHRKECLWKT